MRKQFVFIVIAMALLLAMVGIATAATVTQSITYQGVLTDSSGNPLSGVYTMTFRLYDVASGGTAIMTEIQDVPVDKGLFTTVLPIDPSTFDGRALWLGVKIGADLEMTPRQEIRPMPYALSLRPGAVINVTGLQMALYLAKYDDSYGGLYVDTYGRWNAGVRSITHGPSSTAFSTETLGASDTGYSAVIHYQDSDGVTVRTERGNSVGYRATIQGDNSAGTRINTSGFHSQGVDVDTSGNESYGVYVITHGKDSDAVRAYALGENSAAIYGNSTQDVGVYGTSVSGYGVMGCSTQNYGVFGKSIKIQGSGVRGDDPYGTGVSGNGSSNGVYGFSQKGVGVSGHSWSGIGISGNSDDGVGVVGYSNYRGEGVRGVGGINGDYTGVHGIGNGYGVWGEGVKVGVYGNSTLPTGTGVSGWGYYGVSGTDPTNSGWGVLGNSAGHVGVEGDTVSGIALNAYVNGPGTGVQSRTQGGYAVDAVSTSGVAVYGHTGNSNSYGIYTPDRLYAGGGVFPTADVAEYVPTSENVSPGTVLIIGDDGKLQPSRISYDTRVAGIVSTAPGVTLGAKETGNPGEALIAVAGKVPCKVDASNGPIHPGDLLTTSDTPGYAMKAKPVNIGGVEIYRPGIVLGKALGTLESGTGTIEVLVTLQ